MAPRARFWPAVSRAEAPRACKQMGRDVYSCPRAPISWPRASIKGRHWLALCRLARHRLARHRLARRRIACRRLGHDNCLLGRQRAGQLGVLLASGRPVCSGAVRVAKWAPFGSGRPQIGGADLKIRPELARRPISPVRRRWTHECASLRGNSALACRRPLQRQPEINSRDLYV